MLGVFEALVPIIAGGVFTKLYNATSELHYPWHASVYFGTIGVIAIGKMIIDRHINYIHMNCVIF